MSYDYSQLMGRIVTRYETQARFSDAMGLSESSVSLRLNNKKSWTQKEISKACQLLDIKDKEILAYFFTHRVQSN